MITFWNEHYVELPTLEKDLFVSMAQSKWGGTKEFFDSFYEYCRMLKLELERIGKARYEDTVGYFELVDRFFRISSLKKEFDSDSFFALTMLIVRPLTCRIDMESYGYGLQEYSKPFIEKMYREYNRAYM